MSEYTCEYCNTTFSVKCNLLRHQKRARYCLQAQGLETEVYKCDCGKNFTRTDTLNRHKANCNVTIEKKTSKQDELLLKVIDKYGQMVQDLQQQITQLASKSNQTNTNNRNMVMGNLQPITDADLQEHLEHLSLDFIVEGAKGYANFAGTYPLKDKVLCTDKSRKRLRYKNEDGEITDDGRVLAQRFFQAISKRNAEILNSAYNELQRELQGIVSANRAGDEDVTSILSKATTLQEILIKSERAARGEDDDFAQEFLSHLSKML